MYAVFGRLMMGNCGVAARVRLDQVNCVRRQRGQPVDKRHLECCKLLPNK